MPRKNKPIKVIPKRLTPEYARELMKWMRNKKKVNEFIEKYGEDTLAKILKVANPVVWAEHNLRDPSPGSTTFIKLREHQKKVLLMDAERKLLRWTRGGGKTVAMVCEMLWKAFNMSRRILVLVPGESQADSLFLYIENMLTAKLTRRITGKRKSPAYTIEIDGGPGKGGSIIRFIILGTSSGRTGSSVRSWTGDDLYIDEAQEIPTVMDAAIVPLFDRLKHVNIWMSGTPGIEHNLFYRAEHEKNMKFKVSHVSLRDLPNYTKELEDRVLASVESYSMFVREFLAEWYETQESFFPKESLDAAKIDYCYGEIVPHENSFKVFTVDWNAPSTGTVIYGFEYYFNEKENRYKIRPFYQHTIEGEKFHKRAAVEHILKLINKFPMAVWAVDKGYGEAEIEDIIYALEELGKYSVIERFNIIDFGQWIEVENPLDPNHKLRYQLKSYMFASFRSALVDSKIFEIPACEDRKPGLLWEMRHMKVKGETQSGGLIFKGEDHRLVCWVMAFYIFDKQFNLSGKKRRVDNSILEYLEDFKNYYKKVLLNGITRDVDIKKHKDISAHIREIANRNKMNYVDTKVEEEFTLRERRENGFLRRLLRRGGIIRRDFFDE